MGATGKHCRVFPAVAEFRDTEPHVTHVLTITVVNRSDSVKRIRFKPPTTAEFTIHQIPSVSVAPGLEIAADLEFFSTAEGDFSDELVVICDDDRIVIPVRAFGPRADLFFDGSPTFDLRGCFLDCDLPGPFSGPGASKTDAG